MDTTDPDIEFDENGVCSHCKNYDRLEQSLMPQEKRQEALIRIVDMIKTKGKGKEYDCVIGVSGGEDSTYVAYLAKTLGLRPIAIHVDNGWDSELAVSNVEKVLKKLGFDLYTYVIDWEEFRDLQVAFLKSSTPDAEQPTDHAIWTVLFKVAAERNLPILIGHNFVTEIVFPYNWSYGINDWRYIKDVSEKHGNVKLNKYPHLNFFKWSIYYPYIRRVKVINILHYVNFNKNEIDQILREKLDWRSYGVKHYESIYTRWFQGYYLPQKFNIDQRRAYLSALVNAGQISRQAALEEIQTPPLDSEILENDMEYVIKKLKLTEVEMAAIMQAPVNTHRCYRSYDDYPLLLINIIRKNLMKYILSKFPLPVQSTVRKIRKQLFG
jgi:N-acetyl sugar amidotransferase